MNESRLQELCNLMGIAGDYYDIDGTLHTVSDTNRRRLLSALGVACDNDAEIDRSLNDIVARRWRRYLPPVCTVWEGQSQLSVSLTVPEAEADRHLQWRLCEETGPEHHNVLRAGDLPVTERRLLDGEPWHSASLKLPVPDSMGYHRLELRLADAPESLLADSLVIYAPAYCYRPEAFAAGQRLWGLTAQLYGLRSQRNWGIGDFTDLIRLIEFAADNGADFVGLNPLHGLAGADNADASPYSPSTRRFLNPLYLDLEAIPEFATCRVAQRRVADERFQAALRSLRGADLIEYSSVAEAKHGVLELLYGEFLSTHLAKDTERAQAFRSFQHEGGDALHGYAVFEALSERFKKQDASAWGWPAWPEPYRDRGSQAVADFTDAHRERVDFFCYLQWNAETQLAAAKGRSAELGMQIGVYADLALSAKWGGADSWAEKPLFADAAHLGAPPDDFNLQGQDWGLPPWHPERLRDAAYRPFIETLRANMHYGGALRIDHVMSLMRCFFIPAGTSPADGTYVHYRFDELRAILALESRRNRCAVIGEDLGTVPDAVRDGLRAIGALGYRVLYFEKDAAGAYKSPEDIETEALTVISTHDLPTVGGFWAGRDLEWRTELGMFPSQKARERQVVARAEDRAKLIVALEKNDLLPPQVDSAEAHPPVMTAELRCALHAFLARTQSRLVAVQVEDLLGESEQANLPGTRFEHPNWRRRVSLQLESWPEQADVRRLLAAMREERPRGDAAAPGGRAAAVSIRAQIPRATYRLQLHAGFAFADAADLTPYLAALGISHCYCSPYLKARPGSTHGYDIVDHCALNPEIGSREDFEGFCETLAANDMGQILDMVPNHMAVMGRDNAWWLDVLENGPASSYAAFFDIDWYPLKEELRGKVLLPVLGDHYGNVLDRGELQLSFDESQGGFAVDYHEHRFPIDPREYGRIFKPDLERLRSRLADDDPALIHVESLLTAFGNLPPRFMTDEISRTERARDETLHKGRLARLVREAPDIRHYIDECLKTFNGADNYPADAARMHALLEAQAYRLAYWRVASDEINYRRFFDINELASLRMENTEVFEATHRLVLELIGDGKLQGLRIDHPDGLYDPRGYFRKLQQRVAETLRLPPTGSEAPPIYLLAEKILADGERLREDWPIHGTTGYDFINLINRLLIHPGGIVDLERVYFDFIERRVSYAGVLYRAKKLIMQTALASELNVLAAELDRLAEQDPHTRDFGWGGLMGALLETIACFPVYRTYVVEQQFSETDKAIISRAVNAAKRRSEAADTTVFEFLREVLLMHSARGREAALSQRVVRFVMQLQQYTAPVAAKGMEDTAFYRYGRLLSLNEVGGTPERPTVALESFHAANRERLARWPHALLSSSTHDTKRSEDVRARLHVLSELPEEWRTHVDAWTRANDRFKSDVDGMRCPDRDTEYFFYQTLFGAWPLELPDAVARTRFTERIAAYMSKAVREAKRRTSWINPYPEYEQALDEFVRAVLDPANEAFARDFEAFQRRAAPLGLLNALTQVVLKLCCPGVADIYQGNELWRFDLVDPDNRRPVDFRKRREMLDGLRDAFEADEGIELARSLMTHIEDGRIKLYLTWRALAARREHPELFERGSYQPLRVTGPRAEHVCAFARSCGDKTAVVAVLRWFSELVDENGRSLAGSALADTFVELPAATTNYVDEFAGMRAPLREPAPAQSVAAGKLFADLPAALWVGRA